MLSTYQGISAFGGVYKSVSVCIFLNIHKTIRFLMFLYTDLYHKG
jgi:hypothetical protein